MTRCRWGVGKIGDEHLCRDPAGYGSGVVGAIWCEYHADVLEQIRQEIAKPSGRRKAVIDAAARRAEQEEEAVIAPEAEPPKPEKPTCSLLNCDRQAQEGSQRCYWHRGVPRDQTSAPVKERCIVEGCSNTARTDGSRRCRKHPATRRKKREGDA